MKKPIRTSLATTAAADSYLACLSLAALAWAQQPAATVNWKDADIRQVVEAVSAVTGKNVILDPRVTGKVTLLSPTPLGPDAMYEAFLSILQVHGYVAIESDNLVKIVPDATARQLPTAIGAGGTYGPDDLTTQVIQLRNVGATQLVSLLRPLTAAVRTPGRPCRLEHADYFRPGRQRRTCGQHHSPHRPGQR